MKRLILVLTVAFLFVSASVFAATVNCIMYSSENMNFPVSIVDDYTFTIETDDVTGDVIAFTDLFSNNFYAWELGGWNTEDSTAFDEGEQIFKNGVTYNIAEIAFDGNTSGGDEYGLWFRCMEQRWYEMVFDCGIIGVNFDGIDGEALFGPNAALATSYIFHAVPIPSAIWLLGSGLIGLVGFRRKFRKA